MAEKDEDRNILEKSDELLNVTKPTIEEVVERFIKECRANGLLEAIIGLGLTPRTIQELLDMVKEYEEENADPAMKRECRKLRERLLPLLRN